MAKCPSFPLSALYPLRTCLGGAFALLLVAGCSSDDLVDMENDFPDLSDLPAAPVDASESGERESLIKDLLDEAESRKDEGYQAPADTGSGGG
jgi:hypothetical protein